MQAPKGYGGEHRVLSLAARWTGRGGGGLRVYWEAYMCGWDWRDSLRRTTAVLVQVGGGWQVLQQ